MNIVLLTALGVGGATIFGAALGFCIKRISYKFNDLVFAAAAATDHAAERSYPMPKVRGGGRKEQPHVQGAVAARAQEGLEELHQVQAQEGQW